MLENEEIILIFVVFTQNSLVGAMVVLIFLSPMRVKFRPHRA